MLLEEILDGSKSYSKPSTNLQEACLCKDLRAVKSCFELNQEVDVNEKNSDQVTPLHFACNLIYATCYPSLEVIEYLLEKGADVHMKDKYGHTPLDKINREIYSGLKSRDSVLENLMAIRERLNKASIDQLKHMSMEAYSRYRNRFF